MPDLLHDADGEDTLADEAITENMAIVTVGRQMSKMLPYCSITSTSQLLNELNFYRSKITKKLKKKVFKKAQYYPTKFAWKSKTSKKFCYTLRSQVKLASNKNQQR